MEIRPIISSLMRSKVAMILIGLQVALTLAIVCNALFIISQRLELMNRPSGMNEADTFAFGSSGFGQGYDREVRRVDGSCTAPATARRRRRDDRRTPCR